MTYPRAARLLHAACRSRLVELAAWAMLLAAVLVAGACVTVQVPPCPAADAAVIGADGQIPGVSSVPASGCVTRPAGDGCNTCTRCDDGFSACTLMWCGVEPW